MEHLLALLAVHFLELGGEERVHLRDRPIGQDPARRGERLEPCGRVARGPGGAHEEPLELLLPPCGQKRRTLHRPHARPDAHRVQVVRDGLTHGVVRGKRRELARVEAARVSGLGEERLGTLGIIGIGGDRQRELLVTRHDVAGGRGEAE